MPFKDPEKAREYNRKKKLEYYHKNPSKFNSLRSKYKKTRATKEKQKEYSSRYYRKKKSDRIIKTVTEGKLVEFWCKGDKCSITWRSTPDSKQRYCSSCNPKNTKTWNISF